jgi:integrase
MPASPIQVRVIGPHLHLFGQCLNHARRRMRARKRQDRGAGARSRTVLEPRVIMSILGHSTILLTMNTYAHVLPEVMRDAADARIGPLDEGIDG